MNEILKGKKTYGLVLGSLAMIIGAYLQGNMELGDAIRDTVFALGFGTMRHGISNK